MRYTAFYILVLLFFSCKPSVKPLPILGNATILGKDTTYPTISDFSFTNQDGEKVTNATFANKIYVADFIFLSCPTICPVMTKALQQVSNTFAADKRVAFISHSIDPVRDSVPRLKAYTDNMGISSEKWHFVTGNQDSILNLAQNDYFSTAYPDSTAPGGFAHSGGLLLVDTNRHIRGVYNSIEPKEIERLTKDIKKLLKELF